jgi:hypothetical protein
MDAEAARLQARVEAGYGVGHDHYSPAARNGIDVDHPARERDRAEPAVQHWRGALARDLGYQRKAGGGDRQTTGDGAPTGNSPQEPCSRRASDGSSGAEPDRRLHGQCEIDRDADAEKDRQPEDMTFVLRGEGGAEPAVRTAEDASGRLDPLFAQRQIRHRLSSRKG